VVASARPSAAPAPEAQLVFNVLRT